MTTISKLLLLTTSLSLSTFAGCVSAESDAALPEFGGGGGKADEVAGDGIYAARFLQARCPGEECRGLQVRLINHDETTCPDGATAAACQVMNPSISWDGTGFGADRIKAITEAMPYGGGTDGAMPILLRAHHDGGKLVIDEVWREGAEGREPVGAIVGVVQDADGALLEQTLNVPGISAIGDLDLELAGLWPAQTEEIYAALPKGVIIAGDSSIGLDGTPVRSLNQYWVRVTE
ncbi:MAG: hypothetical protein KBG28_09020 [Kofleriaceae bacterium]|nr:hypothetical protein [Kofleriaceae bacterium]